MCCRIVTHSFDCKLKKKWLKGTKIKLVEIADDSVGMEKKKTFTSLENYTNILCNISKY